MDSHFRAFSFVDRIDSIQAGVLDGRYTIPGSVSDFPLALVGEAIGQLAAWHAMAESNFEARPLAGLASKIRLLGTVQPGDTVQLHAEVASLTPQAMSYSGMAMVSGNEVLRLEGCVGPMLPVEQFDSPDALRGRYADLLEGAAATGGFEGVPQPDMELHAGTEASLEATLHVPADAAYFGDHFPRMPVLPGTLQIDAQQRIVQHLLSQLPASWSLSHIESSKLRAFVPPGASLLMEAKVQEGKSDDLEIALQTRHEGKIVGAARWHAVRRTR